MAKTPQELIQEALPKYRDSAQLAVDYLDGDQLAHFEAYLDVPGQGIKNWRKLGYTILWENVTGLVIDRSAQTYQNPPQRVVLNSAGEEDTTSTENYNQLLADSNAEEAFFQAVDSLMNKVETTGLIIDFRMNAGGNMFLSNKALALLFNKSVSSIGFGD